MTDRLSISLNRTECGFATPPKAIAGWDGPVRRLHLNESPHPASPKTVAAMVEATANTNRYPDGGAEALRAALADHTGHPAERIVIGNGSHELILLAGRIALDRTCSTVAPAPTFYGHHRIATLSGAELLDVPVRSNGSCDIEAMLEAIRPDTALVSLVTPNNPTGTLSSAEDVERLAQGVPESVLLLVDEAYFEFGRAAGGPDVLAILSRRTGPWLLLRTFSKAYGLAGARIGYGLSSSVGLGHSIKTEQSTFQINSIALAGALAALGDQDWMHSTVADVIKDRDRLSTGMRDLGFDPFESATNFLLARSPIDAGEVVKAFTSAGTLIGAGANNSIRISIGNADDVDHCMAILAAIVASK